MMKPSIARIIIVSFVAVQFTVGASRAGATPTLAERLGFKATDKILIINVDDVGNSHAANAAVIDAMENGLATSSTIIVPGPWFPEIAAYAKSHSKSDFGVHLAHTSEWKTLKWGPVANKSDVPGLVDPQGYLWPDIMSVYKNSTPEQAYIEARAQIKKALDAGIDVTHIDSHMGTLQYNEAYFQVYRRLAELIQVADARNFKLAINYEGLDVRREPLPANRVAADLDYFRSHFASDPAFQLFDKPLVIWAGTWKFSAADIARVALNPGSGHRA